MVLKQWEVYIIETQSGKFYTGITNELERRFKEHVNHKRGAKFFSFSKPKKIVFREAHENRSKASIRECSIKKMTRKEKIDLCNNFSFHSKSSLVQSQEDS